MTRKPRAAGEGALDRERIPRTSSRLGEGLRWWLGARPGADVAAFEAVAEDGVDAVLAKDDRADDEISTDAQATAVGPATGYGEDAVPPRLAAIVVGGWPC